MQDSARYGQSTGYFTLGNSGLRVSRLRLGTMTLAPNGAGGADESIARQLFDRYLAAGRELPRHCGPLHERHE